MRRLSHWLSWSGFVLFLIVTPLLFPQEASLSLLSQMGTAMILALSYNMLLGQGGMLSFGHAVYSGLGAFCAAHAMNMAASGSIWLPVTLVPLVGGLAGMMFGGLFGYVATRKSGTAFAMITLGIVELVSAGSLMLPEFFGGEGGVPTNRAYGHAWWGIDFGSQKQVYYLIAFWLFVSAVAMYAFTRTPLGRLLNAVRDNPERTAFIGYDPRHVRYLVFMLSSFFAGISGALSAVNFEIATAENLGLARSGAVLIFTYLGGIGVFAGPMLGAAAGVFLTVMLSAYTKAWQLYLGLLFIFIIMRAPDGLAGMVLRACRCFREGTLRHHWSSVALTSAATILGISGLVLLIEMLYRRHLEEQANSAMTLFGIVIDSSAMAPWLLAAFLIGTGLFGLRYGRSAKERSV